LRKLIECFYSAFNDHNTEVMGKYLSEDFTQTTPYGGSINKEQLLKHLQGVYANVEDIHINPKKWFIDGNEAAVVIESTGKHVGKWKGIQGTGKTYTITVVHLFKARGEYLEHWRPIYNVDQLKNMLRG